MVDEGRRSDDADNKKDIWWRQLMGRADEEMRCSWADLLWICIEYEYSGRRFISAPSAKITIFLMAVSQEPINIFKNSFFILSSMGSTYIDNIFSFLSQRVF